ncbi:MAG TPA: hypothetical protein VE783_12920 [Candidatus Limnocylindrales bacterium]|nr:hypothetical protein [Candidatus Limnocylindrales bacterium]
MGKYYIWFVIVVAGLAGAIRVMLPRRFAELQLDWLKRSAPGKAKLRALLFLVVGISFGALYFIPWGHQAWVIIGTIFSFISAAEVFFQAQYPTLDSLVFQSRLVGILYLGLAAGSYVMLSRI